MPSTANLFAGGPGLGEEWRVIFLPESRGVFKSVGGGTDLARVWVILKFLDLAAVPNN
jgi:hypothetical protein